MQRSCTLRSSVCSLHHVRRMAGGWLASAFQINKRVVYVWQRAVYETAQRRYALLLHRQNIERHECGLVHIYPLGLPHNIFKAERRLWDFRNYTRLLQFGVIVSQSN